MTNLNITLAAARIALLALASAFGAVHAAPVAATTASEPVVLEAVVVTPTARYSLSEWQARVAQRHAVTLEAVIVTPKARYTVAEWQAKRAANVQTVAIVLEPVIVTPTARYTLAQWQQHQAGLVYVEQHQSRGVHAWLKAVWKRIERVTREIQA